MMSTILIALGCISILYFGAIALLIGHGTNFYYIWLALGLLCLCIGFLYKSGFVSNNIPPSFQKGFHFFIAIGIILFVGIELLICSGFSMKGEPNADYVIVLGAQMKKNGPSRALQYRLDQAIDYIGRNPDAKIIVSGGQGDDEHISEAQGMQDYLILQGVPQEQILMEDESRNTVQNLQFSSKYLNKNTDHVVVISNNFHMYRSIKLAKKAGYQHVSGEAAKCEIYLQPNNMVRECIGVLKDFIVGNL